MSRARKIGQKTSQKPISRRKSFIIFTLNGFVEWTEDESSGSGVCLKNNTKLYLKLVIHRCKGLWSPYWEQGNIEFDEELFSKDICIFWQNFWYLAGGLKNLFLKIFTCVIFFYKILAKRAKPSSNLIIKKSILKN